MSKFQADVDTIRASGLFDPGWYTQHYPAPETDGIDAVLHFALIGWRLGRSPSLAFDLGHYLTCNPDVARADINPLLHYIESGRSEGRPIRSFTPSEDQESDNGLALEFIGTVDSVESGYVTGWVSRRNELGSLTVDLLVDDEPVCSAEASEYRADLRAGGVGIGCHSFALQIPARAFDGEIHYFAVREASSRRPLASQPIVRRLAAEAVPSRSGARPLKILLATHHLLAWTGSELTVATLASLLHQAGHRVLVYASYLAVRRQFLTDLLGPVDFTSDLRDVQAFAPRVAYTQHHPVATTIRAALPDCPIMHAILGVLPFLEQPPQRDLGLSRILPISEESEQRVLLRHPDLQRVEIFRNLVDDTLFAAPPIVCDGVQTVVCFSYRLSKPDFDLLQTQTTVRGLELIDCQPAVPGGTPYNSVAALMMQGQIVVASGRGAIEAMLCGRVPLIMSNCGDDGLVTPDNFALLMQANFSGRHRGTKMSALEIGLELDRYDSTHGAQLKVLAQQHLGTSRRRDAILQLFERVALDCPPVVDAIVRDAIAFEAEGIQLQRVFASQAAAVRLARETSASDCGSTDRKLDALLALLQADPDSAVPIENLMITLVERLSTIQGVTAAEAEQRMAGLKSLFASRLPE